MDDKGNAGCLCGQVRLRISGDPATVMQCHCTDCQKLSASSFSISMVLNRSGLEILSGDLKQWDRPADSGNITRCWFCPTCGNRIYHDNPEAPEYIRLKPGTLDDTSVLSPQGHAWTCREQPWHQAFNELPRVEGQVDLAAAIQAIRDGGSPF